MKEGILLPAWKEEKAWYFFGKVAIGDPKNKGNFGGAGPMMNSSPMMGVGTMAMTGAMTGAMNGPSPEKHIFTVDMDNGKTY